MLLLFPFKLGLKSHKSIVWNFKVYGEEIQGGVSREGKYGPCSREVTCIALREYFLPPPLPTPHQHTTTKLPLDEILVPGLPGIKFDLGSKFDLLRVLLVSCPRTQRSNPRQAWNPDCSVHRNSHSKIYTLDSDVKRSQSPRTLSSLLFLLGNSGPIRLKSVPTWLSSL